MDELEEEAKAVFNQTMFNTLLVEFLRETNIPFVVVHNSKFKAIFRFICPSIRLPTHEDLIKLNVNNYGTFKDWEKVSNSTSLNEERLLKVEEWTREELLNGKNPKSQKEQSFAELLQIDPLSGTSSVRGFQGEDNSLWRLPTQNDNVQYFNNGREIEYEVEHEYPQDDYGIDEEMMREERKPDLEDFSLLHCEHSPTPRDPNYIGTEVKEENVVQNYSEERKPSIEPVGINEAAQSDQGHSIGETKTEKKEEEKERKLVINDVPGFVKWPCLVCSQQKKPTQLRDVGKVDAYFMIYICTQTGQYSMKYAKELARMKSFKICVSHLSSMYNNALDLLNIIEPRQDIYPESPKIIDMYHAIKQLRDPSYDPNVVAEPAKKHMQLFITSCRRFFETYGRHNYVTKEDYPPRTTDCRYRPY
ncbi:unnamed protein product [Caenorhabditis brenneri]